MKTFIGSLIILVLLVGVGYAPFSKTASITTNLATADIVMTDPYGGWKTVNLSGVLTLRIPPDCLSDSDKTYTAIVCPSDSSPTPPPEMFISTDGSVINIRRWEDLGWKHWDAVIASIQILTPLAQEIQLTIQK